MPKKFSGVNSKAAAAKARKEETAAAERDRRDREKEDLAWADEGSKGDKKKKERREEQERKRQEQMDKRQERQKALEEEEAALKSGKKTASGPASKVTRDDIQKRLAASHAATNKSKEDPRTHLDGDLEENLNRASLDESAGTGIDQALEVMATSSPAGEKHPEKRMKAAYETFEKERLPELKRENPNARLSQLKQMLRKEWMKHPSNPFNKNLADYNTKK